jgi:branched-chain amino acid transport system substrate-binding protein
MSRHRPAASALRRAAAALAAAILLAAGSAGAASAGAGSSAPTELTIGALFDLTGDGKALGRASKAALEVAAADVERASRGKLDVHLDVRDTQQNPQRAVQQFIQLVGGGAQVVVGPQTSGEVRALLEAGASNSPALIVSNASTASSLAFPGDAVYRLVPDDRVEGAASADLMAAQDQNTVVVSYRVDPSNEGLAGSTTASVRALGGTAVAGPVYPGGTTSFGGAADALALDVSNQPGGAAVYIAGFDEVADYLAAAADEDVLANRTFYGSDGSAKSQGIIDDPDAARMAAASGGFASPVLTVPARALREARGTIAKIQRKSQRAPSAYSLAAYDALRLGVEALQAAGADPSGAELRFAFAAAASGYDGVTGEIELNDAGDRASGSFTYWAVCKARKGYEWRTIGSWTPSARFGQPGVVRVTSCGDAAAG